MHETDRRRRVRRKRSADRDAMTARSATMACMSPRGSDRSTLVLITGLPGVGKSTLAEAVGRRSGVPDFALDWLLGAVVQSCSLAPANQPPTSGSWAVGCC